MKETILYVENDEDDAFFLNKIFASFEGAPALEWVGDSAKALACLRQKKQRGQLPSLVLLDVNLPMLNGTELAQQIKEEEGLERLKLAFISTSKRQKDLDFAERIGAAFFQKPNSVLGLEMMGKAILSYCQKPFD